jgi:HD-like signal output (HDOD) protein
MSADTTTQTNPIVEKAVAGVGDLATLPEVTIKIIEIVEDTKSTARDLHEVIKNDPALSAKILKVVNSAFYGLPGQVATVDRAIVLLGMSAVKNIAVAASVSRMFKGGQLGRTVSAKDLWKHSMATAACARMIAKSNGEHSAADEVFLAGLIHDLGLLIERQAFANELAGVIDGVMEGKGTMLELEQSAIGADHQQFGEALTTRWKFPKHLRAAVGHHHTPEVLSPELKNVGYLMYVADTLVCRKKVGFYQAGSHQEITAEALEHLKLTQDKLTEITAGLDDAITEVEGMLT